MKYNALDNGDERTDNVRYTGDRRLVYLTRTGRAAAGQSAQGVPMRTGLPLVGVFPVELDMSLWAQLEDGIYLHRIEPRLLVVPSELPLPPWCRDMVAIHDRGLWMRAIYDHALGTYEEVAAAGVEYTDVLMSEVTCYVV